MAFGLYKRGQGRWARGIAAVGLSVLGIWATLQTHGWMKNHIGAKSLYAGWWVPGLILVTFLGFTYYVANWPKTTDFVIDTETEMKKVTWPTYREVLAATAVVIVVVIILGVFLFAVDRVVVEPLFKLIGILPKVSAG